MPVVDPSGQAFEIARSADLRSALWRVEGVAGLGSLHADTVVLYAAYDWDELERGSALMHQQPTIVLGMGLGPHAGSRALNLGAIGYLHDGLERSVLCDALVAARLKQQYRRLRAAGGLLASG